MRPRLPRWPPSRHTPPKLAPASIRNPWAPEAAAQDQVKTSYDNASVISDAVNKAWDVSQPVVKLGIFNALNGRRVAPGITLAGGTTDLKEITDMSLLPAGPTIQFRVPNTVVHIVVGVKAIEDMDSFTADFASFVLSPQIDVSFDMLLNLSLSASGNAVTATGRACHCAEPDRHAKE